MVCESLTSVCGDQESRGFVILYSPSRRDLSSVLPDSWRGSPIILRFTSKEVFVFSFVVLPSSSSEKFLISPVKLRRAAAVLSR